MSVDLRGHGDSEWASDADYTPDAFAADVVAVAGAFDRPVLIGASLGGVSSLAAFGVDPGVGWALVLVDVAPRIEPAGANRVGDFMRDRAATGFASLEEVAGSPRSSIPTDRRAADRSSGRFAASAG